MTVSQKTVYVLVSGLFLCATGLCLAQSEGLPSSGNPTTQANPAPAPPPASRAAAETLAPSVKTVSPPEQPASQPQVASPGKEPAANPGKEKAGPQNRYVIGPLDVLVIKVWNQQQLSGAFDVGPDGLVSMSLIGEVKADGLTTSQLRDVIQARLKDCCLNDPIVEVSVGKINSKRVFVYGEVLHQGPYPLIEKTTIMDVLSEVGFKDFANPKKITIQRGETTTFHFNYEDFRKGKNRDKNVNLELQNGDRIYVP